MVEKGNGGRAGDESFLRSYEKSLLDRSQLRARFDRHQYGEQDLYLYIANGFAAVCITWGALEVII